MKLVVPTLFACLLICTTARAQTEPAQPWLDSLSAVFGQINTFVLKDHTAYERLKEACTTIGHRLTGSENGARVEQLALDTWKADGIEDVRFFPFEVEAWSREHCVVRASYTRKHGWGAEQTFDTLLSTALAQTPVAADVKRPLVDVGNGLPQDYEALRANDIRGAIFLINLGLIDAPEGAKNLHRSDKTLLATQNGAAGVLFIYDRDGDNVLTGTASVDGKLVPIPVACITKRDGAQLREWLAEKNRVASLEQLVVHIEMRNQVKPIYARNVIATIPGSTHPHEKIVVGGHLDSWDLSHCAIDNGIGSFSVLDMARVFQALNLRPRRTVEFVLFMGEEQGLLGSREYMNEARFLGEHVNIRAMMNLDMTGNPVGINAAGRPELLPLIEQVGSRIQAIHPDYENTTSTHVGLHSDHQPFMVWGIPVMWAHSKHDPGVTACYHSNCDVIDLVNPEHMRNNVRVLAMMAYALADAPELPVRRFSQTEVKHFLRAHNLEEKLRLRNEWMWGD